jgi:hypothetical protein
MLQVFYLNVAYVAVPIHICCTRMCCKCFIYVERMLQQMLYGASVHEQARQGDAGEGGPLRRSGPPVRAGSEAGAAAGAEHKAVSVGAEHEVASISGQQERARGEVEHEAASIARQQVRSMR